MKRLIIMVLAIFLLVSCAPKQLFVTRSAYPGLIQNFTGENGGSFQIDDMICTNHNDPDQENLTMIDNFTLRYQIWNDTYWPGDANIGSNRADSPCFTPEFAAGADVVSDFSFMIEPGSINTAKYGTLIIQWHYARNTDPPPITLTLGGAGYAQEKLGVEVRYGSNHTWVKAWTDDALVQRGHWYHARMETNFQNYLRVYIDGKQVVNRNAPVGDGSNVWFTVGPLRAPAVPESIAINYSNIIVRQANQLPESTVSDLHVSSSGISLPEAIEQAQEGDTIYIEGEHDLGQSVITVDKYLHFVGGANAVLRNGSSIQLHQAVTVENITFRDWRKNWGDSVFLPAGDIEGLEIRNNVFENVPAMMFWRNHAYTFRNITIADNILRNINSPYNTYPITLVQGTISDITITGNVIENVYSTNSASEVVVLYIGDNDYDVEQILIANNLIEGIQGGASVAGRGILAYGNNITVQGNTVRNIDYSSAPRTCIYLKADDSVIDGNTLEDCGNLGTGSGALTIKGDGVRDVISNNIVMGHGGMGIYTRASAEIVGNTVSSFNWSIYVTSSTIPHVVTINDNNATGNVALSVGGSTTSGTGCGNNFVGSVTINASEFGLCNGEPTNTPTNTPEPTETPVPPTRTNTPVGPVPSTMTPTVVPTLTPRCYRMITQEASPLICYP